MAYDYASATPKVTTTDVPDGSVDESWVDLTAADVTTGNAFKRDETGWTHLVQPARDVRVRHLDEGGAEITYKIKTAGTGTGVFTSGTFTLLPGTSNPHDGQFLNILDLLFSNSTGAAVPVEVVELPMTR